MSKDSWFLLKGGQRGGPFRESEFPRVLFEEDDPRSVPSYRCRGFAR